MRVYRNLNYEQLVELWRREELKRRASRPTVLFHNNFTPAVTSFGWAVDAGSAPSATSLAASGEDGTYDVDVSSGDVQLYLFIQIEEQGDDSSANNQGFQLRFDPAGGTTWQNVTAATSGIYGTADANTAATDEQAWTTGNFKLTGEEGTAYDGLEMTDDMTETAAAFDFQAANYTELVFAVTADSANLSDSQSITFNVAIGGTDITLDVTPTLTVTKVTDTSPEETPSWYRDIAQQVPPTPPQQPIYNFEPPLSGEYENEIDWTEFVVPFSEPIHPWLPRQNKPYEPEIPQPELLLIEYDGDLDFGYETSQLTIKQIQFQIKADPSPWMTPLGLEETPQDPSTELDWLPPFQEPVTLPEPLQIDYNFEPLIWGSDTDDTAAEEFPGWVPPFSQPIHPWVPPTLQPEYVTWPAHWNEVYEDDVTASELGWFTPFQEPIHPWVPRLDKPYEPEIPEPEVLLIEYDGDLDFGYETSNYAAKQVQYQLKADPSPWVAPLGLEEEVEDPTIYTGWIDQPIGETNPPTPPQQPDYTHVADLIAFESFTGDGTGAGELISNDVFVYVEDFIVSTNQDPAIFAEELGEEADTTPEETPSWLLPFSEPTLLSPTPQPDSSVADYETLTIEITSLEWILPFSEPVTLPEPLQIDYSSVADFEELPISEEIPGWLPPFSEPVTLPEPLQIDYNFESLIWGVDADETTAEEVPGWLPPFQEPITLPSLDKPTLPDDPQPGEWMAPLGLEGPPEDPTIYTGWVDQPIGETNPPIPPQQPDYHYESLLPEIYEEDVTVKELGWFVPFSEPVIVLSPIQIYESTLIYSTDFEGEFNPANDLGFIQLLSEPVKLPTPQQPEYHYESLLPEVYTDDTTAEELSWFQLWSTPYFPLEGAPAEEPFLFVPDWQFEPDVLWIPPFSEPVLLPPTQQPDSSVYPIYSEVFNSDIAGKELPGWWQDLSIPLPPPPTLQPEYGLYQDDERAPIVPDGFELEYFLPWSIPYFERYDINQLFSADFIVVLRYEPTQSDWVCSLGDDNPNVWMCNTTLGQTGPIS